MRVKIFEESNKRDAVLDDSQILLAIGSDYEVLCLSLFRGEMYFLVYDNGDRLSWYPSALFYISDAQLDFRWCIGKYDGELSLIIGPDFIANSIDNYCALVEGNSEIREKMYNFMNLKVE